MAENMGKWASGNRKIAKSGHRVAAEMVPFPRRWHGGMISANQEAIWGMSVNTVGLHVFSWLLRGRAYDRTDSLGGRTTHLNG